MILYELCQKDVIDLHTGKNLGTVDDIAFDETSAIITHLVIYGKWKLFGLLGQSRRKTTENKVFVVLRYALKNDNVETCLKTL